MGKTKAIKRFDIKTKPKSRTVFNLQLANNKMKAILFFLALSGVKGATIQGSPDKAQIDSVLSPDFQVHIIDVDENGHPVVKQWVPDNSLGVPETKFPIIPPQLDYPNYRRDTLMAPRNFSDIGSLSSANIQSGVPAIIEIVIVVDKEFGDLFGRDYNRVVDYLTIYFWDVNIRYKTLPSVDISFKVNGLLIMESPQAQPFIENARAPDGRAEFGRILDRYKKWVYEQRGWLVRHDLAPLITAARLEWGGGLAHGGGACGIDDNQRIDWGTCVFNDGGDWGSITVGAHEMAHTVGAPHDDDPGAKCSPPYGFIMSGGNDQYKYFFSDCSDRHISSFVNSNSGSCLKRIDGYSTTPMDPNFSSPKMPSMSDLCKKWLNNPNAWIDLSDSYDCKQMRCKRRDDSNPNLIWTHFLGVLENSGCGGDTGRCFRGRCRPIGKLLRNVGDGNCIQTTDQFGHTVLATMEKCPTSKDRTPLNSIEIRDGPGDKRLATPFTEGGNTESGDRCMYTGNGDGGYIWTDRCSNDNPWHGWEFRTAGGSNFLLVHKVTGRCAIPAGGVGVGIQTFACNSGNSRMLWTLSDGV